MFKDPSFWFSTITALVAVIALRQTKRQTEISNKQHLFDKRLESYLIVIGLLQLYKENRSSIEENNEDKPDLAIDLIFVWMTNNSYLEHITQAIYHTLNNPEHIEFLKKMEELKNVAAKTKFLYSEKSSRLLEEFILCYQELLFAIYKYKILLEKMHKASENFKLSLEEAQEKVNEKKYRIELYARFNNLKESYSKIEKGKVIEKIKKQIRL